MRTRIKAAGAKVALHRAEQLELAKPLRGRASRKYTQRHSFFARRAEVPEEDLRPLAESVHVQELADREAGCIQSYQYRGDVVEGTSASSGAIDQNQNQSSR